MTTREADKIIKNQQPTTVYNSFYKETFTKVFVRRDKFKLYSADGGVFERKELEIVK